MSIQEQLGHEDQPEEIDNYSDENHMEIAMTIVKKYNTDMRIVQFMAACSDGSLWASENCIHDELKMINSRQGRFDVSFMSNIKVYGMVVSASDDLIFSTDGPRLLMVRCGTRRIIESQFNVGTLEPKALHLTRSNKLIIGVKSPGSLYPATGKRSILIMDMDGRKKADYQYDQNRRQLFTFTWGISSTAHGNICVIDRLGSDNVGRVVVLDRQGKLMNTYHGHPVEKSCPFYPRGIVVTKNDNILVTANPAVTANIHILDSKGQQLAYFNTSERWIEMPFSLALSRDRSGILYLGTTTLVESNDKAELYKIVLSGCYKHKYLMI